MLTTFKLITSRVWRVYLWPVLSIFFQKGFLNLLDIVYQFVAEADGLDMTGDEKYEWVAEQLRKQDWGTGNKLADSVIAFLIELAVQRLKAEASE